ncbi:GIY-YIG nuclease family protein [Campylobacter devanensis]|uniref:GIY-YIG nuclease family protein n=1 Tax=Campylobacter devanensis TaxID=3161138 RepID=UPI000A354125|nr:MULTISPECIES: GIY-YIG nuclease family protein [unclassified Campylobacter]
MKLKDLLPFLAENQKDFKAHFAIGGGDSKDAKLPLKIFLNRKFNDDQELQTQKNFERKYILSFCYLNKDEWLFVGIYESLGVVGIVKEADRELYKYNTRLTDIGAEFIGKLVVGFKKDFRQSYPNLETCLDNLEVLELKREVIKAEFPGYDNVNVSWRELESLIETPIWKTALENQKAVYLIVDTKTGKKYVGSAYGNDMLLGRWRNYIANGHGGNKLLKSLDFEYIKENFKYSILEIFKSSVDDEIIRNRENFWKEVLLTRTDFGYNGN